MHTCMSVYLRACQCARMDVSVQEWMSVCMRGSVYVHVCKGVLHACQCAYVDVSVSDRH